MTRATRGNPSPTSLTSESPHLPSRARTRTGAAAQHLCARSGRQPLHARVWRAESRQARCGRPVVARGSCGVARRRPAEMDRRRMSLPLDGLRAGGLTKGLAGLGVCRVFTAASTQEDVFQREGVLAAERVMSGMPATNSKSRTFSVFIKPSTRTVTF